MPEYSFEEFADIVFVYGKADGNGRLAQRIYEETYPNRTIPHHSTFASVFHRLRGTGHFEVKRPNAGRPREVRTPQLEEEILNFIEIDPSTSTRCIASELGVVHSLVWAVLHENSYYPYHLQRVQALLERDFQPRVEFSNWILSEWDPDPAFASRIIFSDEAQFTRDGIFNFHNNHLWKTANPHGLHIGKHQQKFSLNVWGGIVGDQLLGPVFLPRSLNGNDYLEFLQNDFQDLLDDVPLIVRQQGYFMHDGAPPHFRRTVRDFLDELFPERWIGRGGPIAWPPRSPDCNPLDFYLWGHVKSLVYATPVESLDQLQERIIAAFTKIKNTPGTFHRVRRSLRRRMEACIAAEGRHFEHFL